MLTKRALLIALFLLVPMGAQASPTALDIPLAVKELKLTTTGYVNTKWKTPPLGTHWYNAMKALGQLPPPMPTSIYWGATLDGDETYSYYYKDPAPNGQPWGDAPWGNTGNTWDRFEQNTGKKVSILAYGQPPPWEQTAFYTGTADIITNRGAIPELNMASWYISLKDIAAGKYDSQIAAWASNVKSWGKPLLFRFNWEMNGDWFPWGAQARTNPAAFIASWRHFHDVVANEGANNVTWVWCPNLDYSGATPMASLYPGDSYVDWACLDGYNKDATSQSFSSLYKASYDKLLQIAPSKPILIGEVSSIEYAPGVKAAWITDMLMQLPVGFPAIKGFVWFNWRNFDNGAYQPFPIESSSSAQTAFATGIANPYFAPNTFGVLAPLTKVLPPK